MVCSRPGSSFVNTRLRHYKQLPGEVNDDEKSDVGFDSDRICFIDGVFTKESFM